MKTQSPDTSPEVEKVYFDMLRDAGFAKRYDRMCALTDAMISLSRQAIATQHPKWTPREVKMEWARRQYGDELVRVIDSTN